MEEATEPVRSPNALPRPEEEIEALKRVWRPPSGLRFITAVNNTYIGLFYVSGAFFFFLFAGVLALLMRTQLAVPENSLLAQETYNQVFTMHGTIMMFLFAVPAVEAMGVYLLPNLVGARDLPFPRLSAYAFWAYLLGGLGFVTTLFFGVAPRGGWYMYPPNTSAEFSPGIEADFWLLGIGFIEISAIAGAIEILVGVLRTRAPGMSLDKLPVFAWAMLVFSAMIVAGFPALILGTALLELERSLHWPFFDAARGGDPLLWQHLFWFFGHPEVYIIFLPAAGFVSMILPTMTGVPLAGYRYVVLALVATGFTSLGVWVHHMLTTGIPKLSISFFSAASMAVAVPSGIQVFAWIATIARGRLRLTVPSLFVLGFLFIFTLGGLTGVMVALVPFDWQVHDTYFVVSHFHYVLIGGMVFPFFGALYYWIPTASRQPLSERLGRWVFGLMFAGFNLAFFPMHVTGLLGMPRRVWTYSEGLGWSALNLTSTAGAYVLGAGVLLFVFDVARRFRMSGKTGAGNFWGAGTLEWLPNDSYGLRSIPHVASRDPLWEQPELVDTVPAGAHYLPGTLTGKRETIVTSALEGRPQHIITIPGPGWSPLIAAALTAAAFYLLTFQVYTVALASGGAAIAAILVWAWDLDRSGVHPPVEIGGGLRLPVSPGGSSSHGQWAVGVLLLVGVALFGAVLFTYGFLWMNAPEAWPAATGLPLPHPVWPLASAGALSVSALLVAAAGRAIDSSKAGRRWRERAAMLLAIPLAVAAVALEIAGHWQSGLRPTDSSYGAVVYLVSCVQAVYVAALVILGALIVARSLFGLLDAQRRATFDAARWIWYFTVIQAGVGLALVHLAPRVLR